MKKLVYLLAMAVALISSCTSGNECRIHGEMSDHSRDGKKIFLVPMIKPDSVGVDSTVIQDGKFEFVTQKNIMAIIRVEMRSRYGLEDLLVVTEPGDVTVRIDTVSSGGGTLLNETLQQWKERITAHNRQIQPFRKERRNAAKARDTITANLLKQQIDSLQSEFKNYSLTLIERLEGGPLKDFLESRISK